MVSGKLKPGWMRVAFGDVVRPSAERTSDPEAAGFERYVGLEHLDPGDLTVRRWGDVAAGTTFTSIFRPGQVLFGKRRAYQRKVGAPDFSGVCSGDIYVFESKDDRRLLPELLPFICQTETFFQHAVGTSAGSLSPRTNWQSLARYEFALPPWQEQRRIANLLCAFNSAGYALAHLVRDIEKARQSAIDFMTDEVGWANVRMEDLCEMQNGRPFPRSEYKQEGVKLLRPGNLGQVGCLLWDASKTVCLPERWTQEASDFVITKGDVLINLTAQSLDDRFMGRVCLARAGDTSLLNQRIGRLRRWRNQILPEYAFRVLQSTRFQRHVTGMCEGSKVKHLFWSHIGCFPIRVPPVQTQFTVVTALQCIDNLLHKVTQRVDGQRLLRPYCLSVLD